MDVGLEALKSVGERRAVAALLLGLTHLNSPGFGFDKRSVCESNRTPVSGVLMPLRNPVSKQETGLQYHRRTLPLAETVERSASAAASVRMPRFSAEPRATEANGLPAFSERLSTPGSSGSQTLTGCFSALSAFFQPSWPLCP